MSINTRDLVDGRPVIRIEPGESYEIAERVTQLLVAANLRIYQRKNHLCYTWDQDFGGHYAPRVQVETLHSARLRMFMEDVARFEKCDERNGCYYPIDAPAKIAGIILKHHRAAFPVCTEPERKPWGRRS
jgi:hypothetical protein